MSRKLVEAEIYKIMDKLDPSKTNSSIYKEQFSNMSNSDFEIMMDNIRDGKSKTFIIAPNGYDKIKLDLNRNKKIIDEMGIKLFHNLTIQSDDAKYKLNVKSLVLNLPMFRMVQTATKKFFVHEDLKSRNTVTGQVTGKSKSGDITYNETMILKSMGLESVLKEKLGILGGDVKGSALFRSRLFENGTVSYKEIEPFLSATGSTNSLQAFFKAAHIKINI